MFFYLLLLPLICAELACFSYVWKILIFSRYNLTASKLLSFSHLFFGNNFCSNAFCGHRQLFGRISRPASCSSLNSHLFVFLPVFFCFECCYFCVIHARERKKGTTFCVTSRKSCATQSKFGLFRLFLSFSLFNVAALLAISFSITALRGVCRDWVARS